MKKQRVSRRKMHEHYTKIHEGGAGKKEQVLQI
jgi:hypothetical protein